MCHQRDYTESKVTNGGGRSYGISSQNSPESTVENHNSK